MRRLLGYTAIALFFLVLIGLIVWRAVKPVQEEGVPADFGTSVTFPRSIDAADDARLDTSTPEAAVESCYRSYLLLVFKSERSSDEDPPFIASCFTANFISEWEFNDTDANPVVLAEAFDESWFESQESRIVSKGATATVVELTLGSDTEAQVLLVNAVQEGNVWKIDGARLP